MMCQKIFIILLSLLAAVYGLGLFSGLLENDSAQFAVMAMRMVQESDFWSLYKGTAPYLDKPHLHYWLAAASYKIFGIHEWSYKLPGLLALFLGGYSVYALAKHLYNTQVARVAALLFLSAQTIVLSGIDLRTDALLTGFVALALWQFVVFISKPHWRFMAVGALATAMAFSTKGHLALVMIVFPLLGHLWFTKQWRLLLRRETLLGLGVFFIGIAPILYAYYLQFDLHPELVIRGKSGRSGIFFILWEQSFERLSGGGMGTNSSDYFFFFHTFLWAFLPFTPVAIYMLLNRLRNRLPSKPDQGLLYGLIAVFLMISFAQFKLPHYLNASMGLWAILCAGFLNAKGHSALGLWQKGIFILLSVLSALVMFWLFPPASFWPYILFIICFIGSYCWVFKEKNRPVGLVVSGVLAAVLVNGAMNLVFYPSLLQYQAGTQMAKKIQLDPSIDPHQIYKWGHGHSWAMDFGLRDPLKIVETPLEIEVLHKSWLYVSAAQLAQLRGSHVVFNITYAVPKYRITRLKASFLNPATRAAQLEEMFLIYLD